ncbi:hypothetical protein AB0D08_38305 [Kitasatospora sp. NPDC048540]|uniref:hypothetical protein n=1 Tax=Kitasatospora sp. NPDC048540 TaxID=3155634 RepID=UPI0033C76B55
MTAPPPSEPTYYALTSIHTDPYLAGTDGPSILTTDPATAAQFFLDTDRPGHLEVIAHATGPDHNHTLHPVRPGDIVHRALTELAPGDVRRHTLRTAQADWLQDRLWDRRDEPYGQEPAGPDWIRAGAAWGTAFPALPAPDVVADLLARHPGAEDPWPMVMTAMRTLRAVRQARGPVDASDKQLLTANWRILNAVPSAGEQPAARAAAAWYEQRLAEVDPAAQPPGDLTDAQRERWHRGAAALQRDLLTAGPARRPALIREFSARVRTEPQAAPQVADHARTEAPAADRRHLDAALDGALEHLHLDAAVRERVRAAAAGVLQPPPVLPLPAQPASDADAALHWRRRVPSAQRAAADDDATLTQAHLYVADTARDTATGRWDRPAGSTAPARTLLAETSGRHAVLGRLLALADAEHAATAHEPHLHEIGATAAAAARTAAQNARLRPLEVHFAEQAAHTATFDAGRALLDDALAQQRATVRTAVAEHFPRPDHRLTDRLGYGTDLQALARAQDAMAHLGSELEDLSTLGRAGERHLRPTAARLEEARSRYDTALQRFDDIVQKERPATLGALRALRAVMDLPAPPPRDDGTERLARHRQHLTEHLTAPAAAGPAADTVPATARGGGNPRPRPARLPRPATTTRRGMR